jgi:hypothetical protein
MLRPMTHASSSLPIFTTSNSKPLATDINGLFDSGGGLGHLMVMMVLNGPCDG